MLSSKKNPSQNQPEKIDRLEQQVEDLEKLTRVIEIFWSATQVEEVIQRIIEETLELCHADQGSIFLLGPGSDYEAKTLVRRGISVDEKLDHFLNDLLAGWVTHHKTMLLTDDLIETFGEKNISEKYADIQSVLSTPLMIEDKLIGVINLVSEKKNFGEREKQLMNLLAPQCAQFIRNAEFHQTLFQEARRLKSEIQEKYVVQGIIGHSHKMQQVFSLLERIIPTDVRVLLEGESGTGKERIARIIHYNGPRQNAPFVAVDCGALPASLLESELFGYVKGAFTGAEKDRKGLFEEANTGTLFLDEIANMPSEIQAKFLRAIQEGEIRPVGSSQVVKVNVRIIAAVSGDLKAKVDKGEFREDLFYRLNVVNFPLPPLRERKEDIAMLAHHFLKQMNEKYDKKIKGFKPNTIAALESYPWPGNIRELEHAIERAVVLGESDRLSQKDFPFLESPAVVNNELFKPRYLQDALNEFKREYISQILQQTGGNQKQAAEILNIQRTYLNRLIKELEIKQ